MVENIPEILTAPNQPVEFKIMGKTLQVDDCYVNFSGLLISLDSIIGLDLYDDFDKYTTLGATIGIRVFTSSNVEPIFTQIGYVIDDSENGALDRFERQKLVWEQVSKLKEGELMTFAKEVMRRASNCRRGIYRNLAVSHVF